MVQLCKTAGLGTTFLQDGGMVEDEIGVWKLEDPKKGWAGGGDLCMWV